MNDRIDVIKYAAIIAIAIGIVTIFFFISVERESYSALYISPNTTLYDANGHNLSFGYGVKSYESGKNNYELDFYSGGTELRNKTFTLNSGETLEEVVAMTLPPETTFPDNISLILNSGANETEEVHFWLK